MLNSAQTYIAMMQNPLVIYPLLLWSLVWKGLALWRAARRAEKAWFVALLILNTVGILEIFYLFVFSKAGKDLFGSKKKEEAQAE